MLMKAEIILKQFYFTCNHNISEMKLPQVIGYSLNWDHDLDLLITGICGYQGHDMSLSLADEGIEVTLISDAAVFAMMSRVNKVIVGTHAVMANGGLKAVSGSHTVALAAKYYSVPVSISLCVNVTLTVEHNVFMTSAIVFCVGDAVAPWVERQTSYRYVSV